MIMIGQKKNTKKTFLYLGVFNIVVCVLLFVLAPLVISFVSGKQYYDVVPIFRILVIEYFFSGTFRFLCCNLLSAYKCVNYCLFISIMSVICDIVLNYFMINKMSTIGAAYATLISMVITSLLAFGYLIYKIYKKKFIGGDNE